MSFFDSITLEVSSINTMPNGFSSSLAGTYSVTVIAKFLKAESDMSEMETAEYNLLMPINDELTLVQAKSQAIEKVKQTLPLNYPIVIL